MAGYPSNLAKTFSQTEQFPQHILPLLLLYNAQWWGYESLTEIILVYVGSVDHCLCRFQLTIGYVGFSWPLFMQGFRWPLFMQGFSWPLFMWVSVEHCLCGFQLNIVYAGFSWPLFMSLTEIILVYVGSVDHCLCRFQLTIGYVGFSWPLFM